MSSKGKGRTLELEQIRKAEEKAAAQSADVRKKSFLTIGVIVAAIVAVGTWIFLAPAPPGLPFPNQGNFHLSAPEEAHAAYNSSPPSSGPHLGVLASWGISDEVVIPEIYIHNLEDAGIVFVYSCSEGCDSLVDGLEAVVLDNQNERLLMTEFVGDIVDPEGISHPAAAVAWGRVLYIDELNDGVIADVMDFIGLYEGIDHHAN